MRSGCGQRHHTHARFRDESRRTKRTTGLVYEKKLTELNNEAFKRIKKLGPRGGVGDNQPTMKRIPRTEALKNLFVARTRYRPIVVANADALEGSRIAGQMPTCFERAPRCPRCDRALDYFLTIEADLVGPDVAKGRALSLFACADVDCRFASMGLAAEPPSVIALTHDPSPRAKGKTAGRRLERKAMRPEKPEDSGDSQVEGSKLGGLVFRIQTSVQTDEDDAARRGLVFLLQINEQELDEHTTSLGFWGGEVYVFTKKDPSTGLPTLEGARVTWSNT